MSDMISALRSLLHDHDAAHEAAYQLWTWLPSYRAAERHYGDYALSYMPSPVGVMHEAAALIAQMHGSGHTREEVADYFYCDVDTLDVDVPIEQRVAHVQAWFEANGLTLHIFNEGR